MCVAVPINVAAQICRVLALAALQEFDKMSEIYHKFIRPELLAPPSPAAAAVVAAAAEHPSESESSASADSDAPHHTAQMPQKQRVMQMFRVLLDDCIRANDSTRFESLTRDIFAYGLPLDLDTGSSILRAHAKFERSGAALSTSVLSLYEEMQKHFLPNIPDAARAVALFEYLRASAKSDYMEQILTKMLTSDAAAQTVHDSRSRLLWLFIHTLSVLANQLHMAFNARPEPTQIDAVVQRLDNTLSLITQWGLHQLPARPDPVVYSATAHLIFAALDALAGTPAPNLERMHELAAHIIPPLPERILQSNQSNTHHQQKKKHHAVDDQPSAASVSVSGSGDDGGSVATVMLVNTQGTIYDAFIFAAARLRFRSAVDHYINKIHELAVRTGQATTSSSHVMSCHVMSCHVMSCHVISCHVISYLISSHLMTRSDGICCCF